MREKTLAALLAALLFATACGDDPLDIGSFSVEGDWLGSAKFAAGGGSPPDTARYHFVLELEQTERDITGAGEIRAPADTLDVEVEGVWDYPNVDLVFRAGGDFAPLVYTSTFATPDSLKGTLTGSGFASVPLVLLRQRNP